MELMSQAVSRELSIVAVEGGRAIATARLDNCDNTARGPSEVGNAKEPSAFQFAAQALTNTMDEGRSDKIRHDVRNGNHQQPPTIKTPLVKVDRGFINDHV